MNRKKSFYFFRISNNSKLDLIGGIALLIKQKLISLLKYDPALAKMSQMITCRGIAKSKSRH